MNISKLLEIDSLVMLNKGDLSLEISSIFCCDLLSIAMTKCPEDSVWITVIGNVNTIAVATLAKAGCVILAHNQALDNMSLQKAQEENITIFTTELPIYEVAIKLHELLKI